MVNRKRKNLKEIVITALSLLHAQIDITGMLWIAKGLDFVLCVKVHNKKGMSKTTIYYLFLVAMYILLG